MYISVNDAAEKFDISKRRVQILCEQGRIEGASRVSGVWLIPSEAKKPIDARLKGNSNQLSLFDDISEENADYLSMDQVCKLLSISKATAKNWIRLGKLKCRTTDNNFDRAYIEQLLLDIKSGKDSRLKSRRNKKNLRGNLLYKDYVKSENNRQTVEAIIKSCEQLSEEDLRIILAFFAIQLYKQCKDETVSVNTLFQSPKKVSTDLVFNSLIFDLIGNIDISNYSMTNIEGIFDLEIQHNPYEDTLGFVYISLRDISQRKQTGAYYTPAKTVNALIDHVANSIGLEDKTICDPCCGTGNFLIGLVEKKVPIHSLYGQDIDEISILITRINMFLLDSTMSEEQLYTHFVCNNTLTNTFNKAFSVVLGNPPWGYDFSVDEMSMLINTYITAKTKGMESFDLFVEKGLMMLENDGVLAYVLPEAILSVTSHQPARELIVQNTAFKFVHYLGNAFSGVQCPAIILGLQKGHHGETESCLVEMNNERFIIKENRSIDSSLFSFNMNDKEHECLQVIDSIKNAVYLKDHAKFALGIVTGNNKEYICQSKEEGYEIVLKGSDIYRYAIKETENYIHFVPEQFQQVASTDIYRAKEKLLYRFISEVPVFTYDSNQTLSLNSCNILIPEIEGMSIKYVLAVLNSSVAAYYITKKFNSVKLLRSHIESLPIPLVDFAVQENIVKKVDRIMNSNENISGLYEDIDECIMNVYSLAEKQKEIIHSALSDKSLFLSK